MDTDVHEFIKMTLRSAFDGSPGAKQIFSDGEEVCDAINKLIQKREKSWKKSYSPGGVAFGTIIYLQGLSNNVADVLAAKMKNPENEEALAQYQEALDMIKRGES